MNKTNNDYVKNRLINESDKEAIKGCWIWPSIRRGYGCLTLNGKDTTAHRASYLLFNGPIEDETLQIRHTCHNGKCVNPKHLILGTAKQNSEDNVRDGRQAKGEKMGSAKLKNKEILEIRKLYKIHLESGSVKGPYNMTSLSKMFKVSPSTIGCIVHNRSWRHLLPG